MKVAFLATDMVEQVELTEPWRAVEQQGWQPELVSLQEGEIQGFEHYDKADTFRVDRTVELVAAEFGESEPLTAAVTHAGRRGRAAAERMEELLGGKGGRVEIAFSLPLGPVLCAHTGFDVCGIAVFPSRLSTS